MRSRNRVAAPTDAAAQRARWIRRRILALLGSGELPTAWIVSSIVSRGPQRPLSAEVERELATLCADGLVNARRSVEPIRFGARRPREYTYWRLADGPAGAGG